MFIVINFTIIVTKMENIINGLVILLLIIIFIYIF